MFDTVNFWIDRSNIAEGKKAFAILPYLSEISERQNEKQGYSCSGKCLDYSINCFEAGISLKGSLAKFYFENNVETHTRKSAGLAVEKMSDLLHLNINTARVTRLDVSTVILTKRPPADYYSHLGNKPYFVRLQSTPDTLYYNNHQRQIIFYDKGKEAKNKAMQVPELLQNNNLFRYELRFTKRLNEQLQTAVTAGLLSNEMFYQSIIFNHWYKEFQSIQKLKNQSFMIDNIKTPKEAETALFAHLLQQSGQNMIDEYLSDLKAKNVFSDRKYYSRLKTELNKILAHPKGQQSDLIQELETAIYNVAKYAR
jgi:hypothetical protein